MADPDAAARFRRIEQRAKRETGQQFFWRPGRGRSRNGSDPGLLNPREVERGRDYVSNHTWERKHTEVMEALAAVN